MFFKNNFLLIVLIIVFTIVFTTMPISYGKNLTSFNNQFSVKVADELDKYSIPGAAYAIVENEVSTSK